MRFRSALQTRYSANPESEVRIKIWGNAAGAITRASFPDDPALDADLQSAIVGRTLDEAPPPGLRWPITLALRGIPVIGAGKGTAPAAQSRRQPSVARDHEQLRRQVTARELAERFKLLLPQNSAHL